MRVVVVGTGIAGLIAAVRASARHEVVLVTKAELAESNTRYAQGGIAAALFADDSVASHIADTIRAAAGLSDRRAVEILCGEGPQRVRDLIALGVEFDREADRSGDPRGGPYVRGHEAAHSVRRVLHAGGDATGFAIEATLLRAIRSLPIEVLEHTFMSDLVVSGDRGAGGRVAGIDVLGPDGAPARISADAVILASGGAGQLFRHTTNPSVATGDGVAAAWRAGAVVSDLEFYQFHPTSLAVPGNHLVSEAVRGEGAVLLDEAGRRFLLDVHPDAELAPRDVVARGIAAAMAAQGGRPVLLDARMLGADFLATRFPGITRACAANGIDWTRETVPVTPAAHYWMGGVRTDESGRTSLPGLFAAGEVASTGVHGANRLASNSLLESLVFAWRTTDALDTPDRPLEVDVEPGAIRPTGFGVPASRAAIKDLLWTHAGLERDAAGLAAAAEGLNRMSADAATADAATVDAATVDAATVGVVSVAGREDANLLDLARLLVASALRREESRGAHSRRDFPMTRAELAHPFHDRISPFDASIPSAATGRVLEGAR